MGASGSTGTTTFTEEVRHSLSLIKNWRDSTRVSDAQTWTVADFIARSAVSGPSLDAVNKQLKKWYSEEFLISRDTFLKAQQLAANEYAKHSAQSIAAAISAPKLPKDDVVLEPLFCKDTVYHASICCQAVCHYNAGDYQKFFKNKELVPGHAFEAVSFSCLKDQSFLIALKEESTYYFSFKGRPSLSDWTEGFKSFSEGMFMYRNQGIASY